MSAEIHYGKSGVPVYRVGKDGAVFAARVSVDVLGNSFLPAYMPAPSRTAPRSTVSRAYPASARLLAASR